MSSKILLITLIFVVLIGNVSALGVTPARNTIEFEKGFGEMYGFTIMNSENTDLDIVIYVQGDLAESISLKENKFSISAGEESKRIEYQINSPSGLKPGLNSGEIVIMSLPKKSGTSEAFVGAAVAVVHQVHIQVKYPGKYAEADLNIVDANQNEEVVFLIPVFSRGEHDLVSVRANIEIFNQLGESVANFNSADISVNSGERKEIVSKWKAEVSPGRYLAKVALVYDGETKNLEGQFKVGQPDLELQSIEVKNFRLGEIAKFEMLVENKWSEPIKDSHVQMQIFDSNDNIISDVKSASYDFEPFSKQNIVSYWDTAGVKEGNYETKLFLNYGDRSTSKNVELEVSNNKINVIGVGYVVSADESGSNSDNLILILIIVVVVLILINLLWFIVFRKKIKK